MKFCCEVKASYGDFILGLVLAYYNLGTLDTNYIFLEFFKKLKTKLNFFEWKYWWILLKYFQNENFKIN